MAWGRKFDAYDVVAHGIVSFATTTRCSECPRIHHPIAGDGPLPCPILMIGSKPGKDEERNQVVYSGKGGQELNETYLSRAGLDRYDVRIQNVVQCYDDVDEMPKDKLAECCGRHHLTLDIQRCKPDVVVLMGGPPCRLSDKMLKLDTHHGIPFWGTIMGGVWEGWIWPMYEPALGLRETGKMRQLIDDFTNFGLWWRGKWTPPHVEQGEKDYRLLRTDTDVARWLCDTDKWDYQPAVDCETHGDDPYSIQMSLRPNTAAMILAEDKQALRALQTLWLGRTRILLHQCGGDLNIMDRIGKTLGRMGLQPLEYDDSMQQAFHLCNLPQGLKPLGWRLLGVQMRSWEDVVLPASQRKLLNWIEDAMGLAQDRMQAQKQLKTKVKLLPGAVEKICKHLLQQGGKNEEYDLWDGLKNFFSNGLRGQKPQQWEIELLSKELGPQPILGIGNCDLMSEALPYGCSDADYTGQVGEVLADRRRDPMWEIEDGDETL